MISSYYFFHETRLFKFYLRQCCTSVYIAFLFFSQNLLFTDKSDKAQLKLVDFGFAKIKGSQPMQTPCFTLSYAAPEILRNATGENAPSSYDESVDIWSLGVILVRI